MSFRVFEPIGAMTPVVVSVPHAGLAVPPEDKDTLAVSQDELRRDADLFVDRLYADVPGLGAALMVADVSRYVLDLNRSPSDVDREVCPDVTGPARPSARGLIWKQTTSRVAVMKRALTLAELNARIARLHTPWHTRLTTLLEERRQRFGYAILLDAHSMPSVDRTIAGALQGTRADIVPGDVQGQSCAVLLSRTVTTHFQTRGFSVRPNDPYMGGYTTRHHGRPKVGVHAIQLEVNRVLYMQEATFAWDDAKAMRLKPHLLELVHTLGNLKLDDAASR